jgi:hypothetical protein
MLLDSLSS